MINLPQRFIKDIHSVIETLIKEIDNNLAEIILFGSCAREEIKTGSDIDILILTHQPIETHAERGRIRDTVDLYNVDLVFYTQEMFEEATSLFVRNIKREGISLWKGGKWREAL
ncbi:MAG: nucleotidyltransferase domain-containing protein [Cellulosilyticaceae bacterium]|uniref:nucleotidyltransferase domain-containing protein n=1 Tax=Niameybacter sp. TaxID=2033640 RepID=UPI002FC71C1C